MFCTVPEHSSIWPDQSSIFWSGSSIQNESKKGSIYSFVLYSLLARHSPLILSKAHKVMYGVTSNSGAFTWLENFSTRIFPFLLNTSTKFSSILKWKAGVSILRWVAQCCPAEQQYKHVETTPGTEICRTEIYNKFNRVYLTSLLGQLFRLTTTDQMMAM